MTRRDAIARLSGHAGGTLRIVDAQQGWPALASVLVDGVAIPVTIWIGPVGRSHRGRDDVERRFQNPGSSRPIWIDDHSVPLLVGLWDKDDIVETPTPVVVAADPTRRAGRITRFSIFVGLDLLLAGALSGWSEGFNSDGESLRCLHPALLPELVRSAGAHDVADGVPQPEISETVATTSASMGQMADLARQGLTLQEIGQKVGLTRERVRQVLATNWPDIASLRKAKAARLRGQEAARTAGIKRQARWDELVGSLRELGIEAPDVVVHLRKSRLPEKTARHFRIDVQTVKDLHTACDVDFLLVGTKDVVPRFTEDDCIRYLRLAAQELGVSMLTLSAYDDFASRQQVTPEPWPTHQTVMKRFGSWLEAVDAAGLDSARRFRTYSREFPAQRCREFLDRYVQFALQSGERPSLDRYIAWAKTNGGPSAATVRNRLGSWGDALAESLSRLDKS